MNDITPASLTLFLAYAKDAGNWGGEPLVGDEGNVPGDTKAQRGNITQLKQAGLIRTFTDRGDAFIIFTQEGVELARFHGVKI